MLTGTPSGAGYEQVRREISTRFARRIAHSREGIRRERRLQAQDQGKDREQGAGGGTSPGDRVSQSNSSTLERGIRSTNGAVEFVARLAVIGDAGDVKAMRS